MNKYNIPKFLKISLMAVLVLGMMGNKGCEVNPFDEPTVVPTPKSDQ